ncbi:MAG TPA: hypothetical protein VFB58_05820 [Chloroflexota bacterium]|nr:hypothetical protein [Chloroflexota bacterium]
MADVQEKVLRQLPADQMLVNPARLATVLHEGIEDGVMPLQELYIYLGFAIVITIVAALWWATQ